MLVQTVSKSTADLLFYLEMKAHALFNFQSTEYSNFAILRRMSDFIE